MSEDPEFPGQYLCNQVKPVRSTIRRMKFNGTSVQNDSGSDVNIISKTDKARLSRIDYPFLSDCPLILLGKFTAVVETARTLERCTGNASGGT